MIDQVSSAGAGPEVPQVLDVQVTSRVRAPVRHVWSCMVGRIGEWMVQFPGGADLSLRLEAFPGGRLYRDLGEHQGHWWATVQVILEPRLLELHGPLFFSAPTISHVSLRIDEGQDASSSSVTVRHRAVGPTDGHIEGARAAWEFLIGEHLKPLVESGA